MAQSAPERAEEPPMYARAWLNLKRNTVALAVFLRRVFVFFTIAIGAPLAYHSELHSPLSPAQALALSAVDYMAAANLTVASTTAQPPPASLSWRDGPLLVGYAAKGLVFPGNLVRAINQMQRVPKKEMRGFLWKLFEHGLELATSRCGWFRGADSVQHDLLLSASAICVIGALLSLVQGRVSFLCTAGLGMWLLAVTFASPSLQPTPHLRMALFAGLWDAGSHLYGLRRSARPATPPARGKAAATAAESKKAD